MSDTKANILIVDDDDGGRYLKAHVLRKHGYNVTEAASGIAAIEQCCLAAPDLVLLDVMLPDVHLRIRGQPAYQGDESWHSHPADLGRRNELARSCGGTGWRGGRLSRGTDRA